MTTYSPDFTPRYKARYRAAGIEHTTQIRGPRDDSLFVLLGRGAHLYDMFNNLAPRLADDFSWISAEYAMNDTELRRPLWSERCHWPILRYHSA